MSRPAPKPMRDSQTIMTELMMPNATNFAGSIFGGNILALADKVAYVCSVKHAGTTTVTASVDRVNFKHPIHVGQLVTCYANVNLAGKTSMEVGIMIEAKDIHTREITTTNSCYFTMVAVDDQGNKVAVPEAIPESAEEIKWHEKAKIRRAVRLREIFG